MKEIHWGHLDFDLSHDKVNVIVSDSTGACCGESRREYLGATPIYSILHKDILIAWLNYMKSNNNKLFKETLADIVKEFRNE